MKKKIIVFVCRGNIVRSPVAEFVFNQELKKRGLSKEYQAVSRSVQGTSVDPLNVRYSNIKHYKDYWKHVRPVLMKMKIDLSKHSSKPISEHDINQASVVLALDKQIKSALLILFPIQKQKIYLLSEFNNEQEDISDPEGFMNKKEQLIKFQEIKNLIKQNFDNILQLTGKLIISDTI